MKIGIDIGGSHIAVGLIDENGRVVKNEEKYLKNRGNCSAEEYIVEQIHSIISGWVASDNVNITNIGIGAPGIISNNGSITSFNNGFVEFDIKKELKKFFPNAIINVLNDAKCAALAEKRLGSLQQYDDCVFMCLGTGIGGATFYEGRLINPHRCAGSEFGHMVIEKNGRACKCGRNGCFEQYGSMKCFKKTIKEKLGLDESLEGSELRDIIRSRSEEEIVKNTIDEYAEYICTGLTNIVNILEPQAICLGGGFVKYEDILFEPIKEKIEKSKELFYKENRPKIVLAELGNDAGMIGSALI